MSEPLLSRPGIQHRIRRVFAAGSAQADADRRRGYRRDHLRGLAQRVEIADREVRIMGSKSDLLRTLAVISGVKSATGGVRSSVLAEGVGFEPTVPLQARRFSRPVP
jgi:hypothetical protein